MKTATKAQFTPGPWNTDLGTGKIFAEQGEAVAGVYSLRGLRDDEENANVRLIAAAPDMYEALQALIDAHSQQSNCWGCGAHNAKAHDADCTIGRAQSIIARVKGQ